MGRVSVARDPVTLGVAIMVTSESINGEVQDLDFSGVSIACRNENTVSTAQPLVLLENEARELWNELGRLLVLVPPSPTPVPQEVYDQLQAQRELNYTLVQIIDRLVT